MVEYRLQHPKKHQKFSIKKWLYMRYVPHHFIEEIGRGVCFYIIITMLSSPTVSINQCSSNSWMHPECAHLRANFIIFSISSCPGLISPCVCTCLHPLQSHPQRSWLLLQTLASIFDHLHWPLETHSDHNRHENVVADTPSSLV